MKRLILTTTSIFIGLNIFAQVVKPCLFIGRYDKVKKGIVCSDRAYVQQGVNNIQEYEEMKKQFREEHKTDNPSTNFISAKQSVIVYEYQMKISGFNCNPSVYGLKTGASIESCEKELAAYVVKYPKEFNSQPNTSFSWQGKGLTGNKLEQDFGPIDGPTTSSNAEGRSVQTKDFGGLNGKFISAKTGTKDIILTRFTNQTKDKLATVLIKVDDGEMIKDDINPGGVLTKKYDGKKLEIQVIYQDFNAPRPSNIIYDFIKGKIRESIINENGKLKIEKPVGGIRA